MVYSRGWSFRARTVHIFLRKLLLVYIRSSISFCPIIKAIFSKCVVANSKIFFAESLPGYREWINLKIDEAGTVDTTRINPFSTYLRMYWTNLWQPTVQVQQNIFENYFMKIHSSYLYASIDTFCVLIGQLFAARYLGKISSPHAPHLHHSHVDAKIENSGGDGALPFTPCNPVVTP